MREVARCSKVTSFIGFLSRKLRCQESSEQEPGLSRWSGLLSRMRSGLHLGKQRGFFNQMLDTNVLSTHPGPARGMGTDVDVQKSAVVDPNSTLCKIAYLQSEVVHFLEREAVDLNVSSHAADVLAIVHAADLLIVLGAAITVVYEDGLSGKGAHLLKCVNQAALDLKPAAAAAGKFCF